jgi:alkylation response protein AidB-like acyl-CoA dehydrogenase
MSEELDDYRAAMRAWLAQNLSPRPPGATVRGAHDITAQELASERARQRQLFDAGYAGITLPVEYGGQGRTHAHQRIWNEESALYAVPAPGGIAWSVTIGIILPTLIAHASEEQKREWVPKMLSAEEIWVQLLSEPGAGSDLAGILTRATRDGDVWVLNGNKVWSSGAMCADFGVCLARTDWDAPKHRGLTWFKVPLHDDRVTVRPIREINGSSEFCEEFLDDVVVGDDMVIGDVNGGWPIANAMLAFERGAGGGEARRVDSRPRAFAPDLVDLAASRGLLGDAAVRQQIARAHVEEHAQGVLAQRLMTAMLTGAMNASAASYLKLGQGIVQPERAATAMEIAGRSALAWSEAGSAGEVAALNYLNGRIMSIAGGSNQIQRNIISERLLGLPREPSDDKDKPFREVLRDAKSWGRDAGSTS